MALAFTSVLSSIVARSCVVGFLDVNGLHNGLGFQPTLKAEPIIFRERPIAWRNLLNLPASGEKFRQQIVDMVAWPRGESRIVAGFEPGLVCHWIQS